MEEQPAPNAAGATTAGANTAARQRGTKRSRRECTAWCDVPANLRNPLGETVDGIQLKGPDGDAV